MRTCIQQQIHASIQVYTYTATNAGIHSNKHKHTYTYIQRHLDIHFRLLREDCMHMVRDGVSQYAAAGGNARARVRYVHICTVTVTVTDDLLNTRVLYPVSRRLSQPVQSPNYMQCRPSGTRMYACEYVCIDGMLGLCAASIYTYICPYVQT